jgi:hypothetical protein
VLQKICRDTKILNVTWSCIKSDDSLLKRPG